MDDLQHPDGVWTWKQDRTARSSALWLPYLQGVEKSKGKGRWRLAYNGGEFDADLAQVDTVMLYGASGSLPVEFLDDLNTHRIPLLVHRRNVDSPYLFMPFRSRDSRDMLSAQIRARDNEIRCCYIARTLVRSGRGTSQARACPNRHAVRAARCPLRWMRVPSSSSG